jgi:hypothetical protein
LTDKNINILYESDNEDSPITSIFIDKLHVHIVYYTGVTVTIDKEFYSNAVSIMSSVLSKINDSEEKRSDDVN